MKRKLALALGLAVISSSAFATKARLQALGEDVYGSKYISDNRNIFINAAYINLYKDQVTFEFGDTGSARDQRFGSSESTGQRAEGGFTKSWGNMVYGVHFGEESDTANTLRMGGLSAMAGICEATSGGAPFCTDLGTAAAAGVEDEVHEQNAISLMLGGDAGLQWGAKLKFSQYKNDAFNVGTSNEKIKSTAAQANFGIISGDLEAFANISLANSLEVGDLYNVEGKAGYQIGAVYNLNGTSYFAEYRAISAEEKEVSALNEDWSISKIILGAGRVQKLNEVSNANYKFEYVRDTTENTGYVDASEDVKQKLDATFGVEVMAKEWLALRGSVSQNIWANYESDGDEYTPMNSTQVRAGASLLFGDMSVDAYTAVANDDSDGKYSRVSMTYKF